MCPQRYIKTETLAIGIQGDRDLLCGAIQRFELNGIQSNGLLTLKELCARHIALIKNEQIKWFITAYLSSNLFKYVTKDIFDLQRDEFTSNDADELDLCDECSMNTNKRRRTKCQCPKLEHAIDKLNKHFFKRMNNGNITKTRDSKQFDLIYKLPYSDDEYCDDYEDPPSFFLYLLPYAHFRKSNEKSLDDTDCGPYQSCQLIEQVTVEDKLLFVDAMRFFGGFHTDQEYPQLILHHYHEHRL